MQAKAENAENSDIRRNITMYQNYFLNQKHVFLKSMQSITLHMMPSGHPYSNKCIHVSVVIIFISTLHFKVL